MKQNLQEIHVTQPTSDGWKLQLFHYPANSNKKINIPVVLCHGLAANKNSCDFGEVGSDIWNKYSLAAYLSQGMHPNNVSFDVWVVELRGRGKNPTFSSKDHPDKYVWCFDDYVEKDVPTILEYIDNYYQKPQNVLWVGKSMGGMIAYAYGQKQESYSHLRGVVTLGSPVIFEYKNPLLELISRLAPRNISIPINISQILQRIPEISDSFKKIGATSGNIEEDIFNFYLKHGMDSMISSKVFSHFSVFFRHNTFCSYPKYPWLFDLFGYGHLKRLFAHYDYKQNLNLFKHPLLAIVGEADKEAPPEEVIAVLGRVGSSDKTYHHFSKKKGYKADYGHLDLNLGKYAKEEVYPVIAEWLYQHK